MKPIRWFVLSTAIMAVSSGGFAGPAPAPPETLTVLSQVYHIERKYKSMEGPAAVQSITLLEKEAPQVVWIRGFKTEIVAEDGSTPASSEFMCHINLDMNVDAHRRLVGWKKLPTARVFTLSQAQFSVDFPKGFGIPVLSNEPFSLATQVLNHNIENPNAKVRHKVTVDFVRDSDLKEPLKPLFPANAFGMRLLEGKDGVYGFSSAEEGQHGESCLPGEHAAAAKSSALFPDSFGRKFSGHWVVKPGKEVNHTNVTKLLNIPYDTTVHYINIHLHPFAESIELKDLTTGKRVFKSRARGPKNRIGLDYIDTFSSVKGVPLYKDHQYQLINRYNNTSGVDQDAMATMFLYLWDKEFVKPDAATLASMANPAAVPGLVPAPPDLTEKDLRKNPVRARFQTQFGPLVLALFPKAAPETVKQILALIRAGAYAGTPVHAIVPGYVIQIGDVRSRSGGVSEDQAAKAQRLPVEVSALRHRRGALSMARLPEDLASGQSSFSVLLSEAPHLDGLYTVFGELHSGWETLKRIEELPRDENGAPRERFDIQKADVLPAPRRKKKAS